MTASTNIQRKENEEEVVEQGGNRTTSTVAFAAFAFRPVRADICQDEDVDCQRGQGQVEQDHLRSSFMDSSAKHDVIF